MSCFVVEHQGKEDKPKRQTEEDVETKMENENGEKRCDQHGTRDEYETCQVTAMFHDG